MNNSPNEKLPKKTPKFMKTIISNLGLRNHYLRALIVMWMVTSAAFVVMNLLGAKKSSNRTIATFILGTGGITLATLFLSTCLAAGQCIRTAYLLSTIGFIVIAIASLIVE
tara:strand:+ start:275 stop:607 length:333 start_codon:yes stop_codon:yes gene_type:complete